eukprot:TRINITY_DN28395_c0_g1_i1.p1 TRINITY_DN28395_c0_g1~~TRINITY_DN28395_c0_g1_i1.p1  ORF type:complete len:505 (+),score=61.59 TRINITY_DN28395_c0_g1_i1:59-1516(+)
MTESAVKEDVEAQRGETTQHPRAVESLDASPAKDAPAQPFAIQETKENGKPKAADAASAKAPRLETLDGPRYIASMSIVCYHYGFYEVGGLWTQFFFILAGFVLAYVEMARPAHKTPKMSNLQYLRKRLITIYPLYGLSICLVMVKPPYDPECMCEWPVLPLHALLLQSIVQLKCCKPWGAWTGSAWFLSALVVYWLMTLPLSRYFRNVSLRSCYLWLAFLWIGSVALWPLDMFIEFLGWPREMQGTTWLAYGPLGYLHVFVAGVVMARIFILTCTVDVKTGKAPTSSFSKLSLDSKDAPFACKYGCLLGYVIWLALIAIHFFAYDLRREAVYLILHNGGMLPLMLLILGGGAAGVDPMAKYVFNWKPFVVLARLSYAQYILHEWVREILHHYSWGMYIAIPVLIPVSYVAQRVVERPFTEWQRNRAQQGILGWEERAITKMDNVIDKTSVSLNSILACRRKKAPNVASTPTAEATPCASPVAAL